MTQSILHAISEDVRFYHRLRFPGRQSTYMSCLQMLLCPNGLFVLTAQRLSNYLYSLSPSNTLECFFIKLMTILVGFGAYISKVLAKSEFLSTTMIEPGVCLSNRGHIILGTRTIGSGTIIHDRVTFGMKSVSGDTPMIGRNVWVGPHCIIYGEIQIGDGVTILPHTVVSKSLPPWVVVSGNPARIIKRNFDNYKLRCTLSTDITWMLD